MIHDIVGKDNFCTLANTEIMQDASLKKRLRAECDLKPGVDATKASLDRIRRAKGYLLSRQVKEKRSTRQ